MSQPLTCICRTKLVLKHKQSMPSSTCYTGDYDRAIAPKALSALSMSLKHVGVGIRKPRVSQKSPGSIMLLSPTGETVSHPSSYPHECNLPAGLLVQRYGLDLGVHLRLGSLLLCENGHINYMQRPSNAARLRTQVLTARRNQARKDPKRGCTSFDRRACHAKTVLVPTARTISAANRPPYAPVQRLKRVLAICSARKPPHISTVSVACSATSAVFGRVGTSSAAAAAAPVSPSPGVRSPVHNHRPCQHYIQRTCA